MTTSLASQFSSQWDEYRILPTANEEKSVRQRLPGRPFGRGGGRGGGKDSRFLKKDYQKYKAYVRSPQKTLNIRIYLKARQMFHSRIPL